MIDLTKVELPIKLISKKTGADITVKYVGGLYCIYDNTYGVEHWGSLQVIEQGFNVEPPKVRKLTGDEIREQASKIGISMTRESFVNALIIYLDLD